MAEPDRYFVTWNIDIEANSHEEAALEVLKIQRDPKSIATVFHVVNTNTGVTRIIDVEDPTNIDILNDETFKSKEAYRADRS